MPYALRPPVDALSNEFEDVAATVAVAKNSTKTAIVTIVTRNARRVFLSFVGQAWDAAIDGNVTWRVLSDGNTIFQLKDSTVQNAAPETPDRELSPWIELPQGSTVRFEADLNNAAAVPVGGGNVTARMKIYYGPIVVPNL